jgi:uncharacterized cupredoxin-like copper-binding protein
MRVILKSMTSAAALTTLATLSVFLAGCGQTQSGSAPSNGSAVQAVQAELGEYYIKLDRNSVPAGKVTFTVTNAGKMEHELIILKTDLAVDKLPAEKDDATRVDEDKVGNSGEVEEIGPGKTKTGDFDLTAGRYVLICNKAGHYLAGQRIAFQVT